MLRNFWEWEYLFTEHLWATAFNVHKCAYINARADGMVAMFSCLKRACFWIIELNLPLTFINKYLPSNGNCYYTIQLFVIKIPHYLGINFKEKPKRWQLKEEVHSLPINENIEVVLFFFVFLLLLFWWIFWTEPVKFVSGSMFLLSLFFLSQNSSV